MLTDSMSDTPPPMSDADDDGLIIPGNTLLRCGVVVNYNEVSLQAVSVPTITMTADLTG